MGRSGDGHLPETMDSASVYACLAARGSACLRALLALILLVAVRAASVSAQDLQLSPTRPTIANSVSIQDKGVLQVEAGYDAYPSDEQTVSTFLSYALLKRLRIDFGWSAFNLEQMGSDSVHGVGTTQVGGKFVLLEEQYGHATPGIGVQYEAELPTASTSSLQGFGQQIILLVNHHYGKNGIFDVMLNGSFVQSDCQTREGCAYGGQQSAALSYHVRERTRLYAEVFGQNNSQANTPPGTYCFGGFYQKFSDSFGLNGGLRFGVSKHSSRFGVTIGVVFGKRLHSDEQHLPQHP
jgi:uncharacterized glyoxalase superfamily protein PhnB